MRRHRRQDLHNKIRSVRLEKILPWGGLLLLTYFRKGQIFGWKLLHPGLRKQRWLCQQWSTEVVSSYPCIQLRKVRFTREMSKALAITCLQTINQMTHKIENNWLREDLGTCSCVPKWLRSKSGSDTVDVKWAGNRWPSSLRKPIGPIQELNVLKQEGIIDSKDQIYHTEVSTEKVRWPVILAIKITML